MNHPTLIWVVVFDAVTGERVAVVKAFDVDSALYSVTLLRRRESLPTVDLASRAATRDEIPVRRVLTRAVGR